MRRLFLSRVCLLIVLFAVFVPLAAQGSIMVALDLAELSARSDVVAVGRVLTALGEDDGRGGVVTRVTVQVERYVSGADAEAQELTVMVPGGEVPGRGGVYIAGAPQLVVGERYLLFLRRQHQQAVHWVVGLSQGAMLVYPAADGLLVVEAAPDLPTLVSSQARGGGGAVPALIAPTPLVQVLEELREVRR